MNADASTSKYINLTIGIGTHDSRVVLQPLEEFVALTGRHYSCIAVNPRNHELSKEKFLKSIISYHSMKRS